MTTDPQSPEADRWAAFRHRPFLLYWLARFGVTFAAQVQVVAVGRVAQTVKDSPQPQVFAALGLPNLKPRPIRLSSKSTSVPFR